jgi:hypothetical protein
MGKRHMELKLVYSRKWFVWLLTCWLDLYLSVSIRASTCAFFSWSGVEVVDTYAEVGYTSPDT